MLVTQCSFNYPLICHLYHYLLLGSNPPPPTNPATLTCARVGGPVVGDQSFLVGDQIQCMCISGAIDGESISTLQADGTWTLDPPPMCKPGTLIETHY